MCTCDRRHFVMGSLISAGLAGLAAPAALAQVPDGTKKTWICPPCGCDMDGKQVAAPGACSACGMPLIEYKPPAKDGEPKPPTVPKPPQPAPKAPAPGAALNWGKARANPGKRPSLSA